ncbi:unnamed protein product [Rangifer tarandus platyrhynchus]|uniref:Uncharacterized protein n=2 Tax=Rangifer tarandus platyrhynchus TaxID=3082113 RepID=A0ABN8ZHM2_RANTA|nr:unnamed protein product [Rangifer tarandus platyrhynchus]CAI9708680.1 unnamed protein product [Rangifer tarandus platyrhynchus]
MMEGSPLSPGVRVLRRCMSPAGPSPNTRPEESFPPRLETPCAPARPGHVEGTAAGVLGEGRRSQPQATPRLLCDPGGRPHLSEPTSLSVRRTYRLC